MLKEHPHKEAVQSFRPLAELVPSHWQAGTITVQDGVLIHYMRTGGDKPALILLHGVQVDGLSWLRTAQALESTYDVILPDQRGHGKTGQAEGMSQEVMIEDIICLIKSLKLENPYVIGHSMGADIAGRLAAAYPLRGVVLVDPPLINITARFMPADGSMPDYMQDIIEAMGALKHLPHKERMVKGLTFLPPMTALYDEVDYVTFVEGQSHFEKGSYRYLTAVPPLFEQPDIIAKIDCPILLLTAKPMPGMDVSAGLSAFTENWIHGQHVSFDCGHAIHFEQFERFIEVVSQFIERH